MIKISRDAAPALLWFRRDLRLNDNLAVQVAAREGRPVVPVFVLEEDGPARDPGAASRWWLDKSLRALTRSLEALGSRLIIRRGPAEAVLDELIAQTGASALVWSHTYEPAVDQRDEALAARLTGQGLEVTVCPGRLLFEPATIRTKTGGAYGVFTPFWRSARAQLSSAEPVPAPKSLAPPHRWPPSQALDTLELHPSQPDWSGGFRPWTPGEGGAEKSLQFFLNDKLAAYPHDRDRPAVDGSSRLSPHLAWGEISPRRIYAAVQARLAAHGLEHQAEKFLTELGWREFDYGLLAQQPALDATPFKTALAGLKWRRSTKDLQAWTRGRTGYPIVDAGMRQLWTMGWMHNRVRLITSSFLVKHLLIDWREGERWFWDCLVDADPANNPANWQWIAGTGADAQPFFRIFAPVAQGERFDPEGDYVRTWIPELAKADRRWIHQPWTASDQQLQAAGVRLGDTYPAPIVEHAAARQRALDALAATRERNRAEA
jgi:deoxyribodipyrimidine photo-lyase